MKEEEEDKVEVFLNSRAASGHSGLCWAGICEVSLAQQLSHRGKGCSTYIEMPGFSVLLCSLGGSFVESLFSEVTFRVPEM